MRKLYILAIVSTLGLVSSYTNYRGVLALGDGASGLAHVFAVLTGIGLSLATFYFADRIGTLRRDFHIGPSVIGYCSAFAVSLFFTFAGFFSLISSAELDRMNNVHVESLLQKQKSQLIGCVTSKAGLPKAQADLRKIFDECKFEDLRGDRRGKGTLYYKCMERYAPSRSYLMQTLDSIKMMAQNGGVRLAINFEDASESPALTIDIAEKPVGLDAQLVLLEHTKNAATLNRCQGTWLGRDEVTRELANDSPLFALTIILKGSPLADSSRVYLSGLLALCLEVILLLSFLSLHPLAKKISLQNNSTYQR